jgi:AcrR family transcriptional regulator
VTPDTANRPRGREAKKLQVETSLVTAALTLIPEKGYPATTIDDIAAHAGVSRRTFFRYFQSKDEVVLGWLDEQGEAIGELLKGTCDRTPVEAMRGIFLTLSSRYDDTEPERVAFLIRLIFSHADLRARYHDKYSQWQDSLVAILGRVQGSREGEALFALRVQVVVGVTAFMNAIQVWAMEGGEGPLRRWVEQAFEVLWGGAQEAPPAG